MALLLTFFVLLMSVSEVQSKRYKAMVESLRGAFGIQWVNKLTNERPGPDAGVIEPPSVPIKETNESAEKQNQTDSKNLHGGNELTMELQTAMAREIDSSLVSIIGEEMRTTIRFQEAVAFASGSEVLSAPFIPTLDKVADRLEHTTGDIIVAGHTDDRPIATERFRSNWDLSAARAISVVHYLINSGAISTERIAAVAYADTQPVFPNNSPENRALNRRVEISILRPTIDVPVSTE